MITVALKKGDKVRCINVGCNKNLTLNKIYEVVRDIKKPDPSKRQMIVIFNDAGSSAGYWGKRFELVIPDVLPEELFIL